jgi:hypothetical protein
MGPRDPGEIAKAEVERDEEDGTRKATEVEELRAQLKGMTQEEHQALSEEVANLQREMAELKKMTAVGATTIPAGKSQ